MNNRISILNTFVDVLTMDETLKKVEYFIENKICVQHVVVNASKVNLIQQDEKLKNIVNNCKIINADGQSIVWAAKKLGYYIPERVTGIDLFQKLIELSNEKGYKIYFFGAKDDVVKKVVQTFKNKYKNLKVVGYRNGYFTEKDEKEIALDIKKSNADILFVGFSSPKKEYWINKYINVMDVPFCMGVGGSFDVVAGVTKRAPMFMQKHGLEWFYRFIQEPRRMWKRYILGNVKFVKLVLHEKLVN